jgi:hypothetical protein
MPLLRHHPAGRRVHNLVFQRGLIMSIRKTLFTIVMTGAFAAPALAGINAHGGEYGDATYLLPQPVASIKTRAEVESEVLRARQGGSLTYVGDYPRGILLGSSRQATGAVRTSTREMGASAGSDVSADGYRLVGGEIGYIYVGPRAR